MRGRSPLLTAIALAAAASTIFVGPHHVPVRAQTRAPAKPKVKRKFKGSKAAKKAARRHRG